MYLSLTNRNRVSYYRIDYDISLKLIRPNKNMKQFDKKKTLSVFIKMVSNEELTEASMFATAFRRK